MLKPIRTTIIGGEHLPDTRRDPCRRDRPGSEDRRAIAKPVAAVLPVSMVGGVAVAHVLAIALLLLICFIAGCLPGFAIARRAVGALEANVLSRVPANALLKTKTQSMLSADDIEGMSVVVVRCGATVGALRRLGADRDRARWRRQGRLFLPGSPDPWSGSVCIAEEDRVTPLICPWRPSPVS